MVFLNEIVDFCVYNRKRKFHISTLLCVHELNTKCVWVSVYVCLGKEANTIDLLQFKETDLCENKSNIKLINKHKKQH